MSPTTSKSTNLQRTGFISIPSSTAFYYFSSWQQTIHTSLKSLLTTSNRFLYNWISKPEGAANSREKSFCSKPKGRQRKMSACDIHCASEISFQSWSMGTGSHSPCVYITWGMQGATIGRKSHPINLKADDSGGNRYIVPVLIWGLNVTKMFNVSKCL